jgi:hypothetical protein
MSRNAVLAVAALVAFSTAQLASANATTIRAAPPQSVGMKQPPGKSGGPHRQPVDPSPSLGSGYSGDSAGGSGGGGYFGDPNHPGHEQF